MVAVAALSVDGDDDEQLRQLAAWLRDEDELRGRVKVTGPAIDVGQMGGVADSIVVVVTSGSAATLCRSVFDWLARRREVQKVSLKVKNEESGTELELDCGSATDAETVLQAVCEFLEGTS
ncbi:hypothetical protein AB5J62_43485 [Amycolatopsis sp. cg5]|uniref:effector-associated constant component EACC1 n=1 Tax=Amycolatopsis sp. cg5 TaxID=3238802 RepID=UPI003524B5ED